MASISSVGTLLSSVLYGTGNAGVIMGLGREYADQQKARGALRQQQDLALQQLQQRQSLEEANAAQNAAGERARIAADAQAAETRRLAALRRSVARQKTLFSAQGIGAAGGGSNEAVLLGLYNDSTGEAQAANQSNTLRLNALEQSLSQQRQKNLLETAQLAESQRIARLLREY